MAAITASTPFVIPATVETQYPEIWLSKLIIESTPTKCKVFAKVKFARTLEDGSKDFAPGCQVLDIENLFDDITADEGTVMYQIVNLVKTRLGI
jgi:hypothetical protein